MTDGTQEILAGGERHVGLGVKIINHNLERGEWSAELVGDVGEGGFELLAFLAIGLGRSLEKDGDFIKFAGEEGELVFGTGGEAEVVDVAAQVLEIGNEFGDAAFGGIIAPREIGKNGKTIENEQT